MYITAILLAIGSALLVRHLILAEIIPWRVSDGQGHGPDRESSEWYSAKVDFLTVLVKIIP